MNYFELFNIPKKFKINQKLLSKNFYNLQLKFHPDLFINCSKSKQEIILQKSIEINKGYKILKDSLNRVIYLLFLEGFQVRKDTLLLKNKDFLIKYFVLYEELDSLKKNNFDSIKFDLFFNKINKKIEKYEKEIEIELHKKNYDKIIVLIGKLLFFKKMKLNLKKE